MFRNKTLTAGPWQLCNKRPRPDNVNAIVKWLSNITARATFSCLVFFSLFYAKVDGHLIRWTRSSLYASTKSCFKTAHSSSDRLYASGTVQSLLLIFTCTNTCVPFLLATNTLVQTVFRNWSNACEIRSDQVIGYTRADWWLIVVHLLELSAVLVLYGVVVVGGEKDWLLYCNHKKLI